MKRFQQHTKTAIGYRIALAALLGMLVVLGVSPALAQAPSTSISPSANQSTFLRQHGPMRFHGIGPDGSTQSENWSGYAVTGSSFTDVKGSWHVPQLRCNTTPNSLSGFWVGIDGFSDDTVEQTGTASYCNGTTAQYYAWYEVFPANPVVLSNFPIQPGQVIGAEVIYEGDGNFSVHLHNRSTGQEFRKTLSAPGVQRSSAEWIAEAPCAKMVSGVCTEYWPLANFHVANYGDDYTSDPDTNTAIDSTTSGPISAFGSNVEEITMVSSGGVTEAVPSSLTSDGTSFRVWWEAE